MDPAFDFVLGGQFQGPDRIFKGMAAVDPLQCSIITGLQAVFKHNVIFFRQFGEIFQLFFIDAIRPGANYKAKNFGKCQCLLIERFEFCQCRVSI